MLECILCATFKTIFSKCNLYTLYIYKCKLDGVHRWVGVQRFKGVCRCTIVHRHIRVHRYTGVHR